MGLWAEPMRPPSIKYVSRTPQVVRGIRVFHMRGSPETLVSLLMLCKLPISSLEFFREKRPRKKRSLINTITLPVATAGSLLSGILTFSQADHRDPPIPRISSPIFLCPLPEEGGFKHSPSPRSPYVCPVPLLFIYNAHSFINICTWKTWTQNKHCYNHRLSPGIKKASPASGMHVTSCAGQGDLCP